MGYGAFVLLIALAVACGNEDSRADDAATSDAARIEIAAPAPAALPTFDCPAGWRTRTHAAGSSTCEPYPEAGPASCAADEAHFPGQTGCVRLGTACPSSGVFPDEPATTGRVWYVAESGAADGDGSRSRPFGSIQPAVERAGAGDVIQLGMGTFRAPANLGSGETLRGACVSGTRMVGVASSSTVVRTALGEGGGETVIENLAIEETVEGNGIYVVGATAIVRDVAIRGFDAAAVYASTDAIVTIERVRISDGGTVALYADTGSEIVARHVFIERARNAGAYAINEGTSITLEDTAILDTRAADPGSTGAVVVGEEASLTLRRVLLDGSIEAGIHTFEAATLVASDVIVRNARSEARSHAFGFGVLVRQRTRATLDRVVVERNQATGISVVDDGTELTLRDVVVLSTARSDDGKFGRGIGIEHDVLVDAERVFLAGGTETSIVVDYDARRVAMRDLSIVEGDDAPSRCIQVQRGAAVDLERAHIVGARLVGINVISSSDSDGAIGSTLTARDVDIEDMRSGDYDGSLGRGIVIQDRARATVVRARFARVRDSAIYAWQHATIDASDIAISDTLPAECDLPICEGGFGIASTSASAVSVERFSIVRPTLCGVFIEGGSTLDLMHGEVREAQIGACVQTDGYDLGTLQRDVRYEGNGTNLDITMLPVPEPVSPL